MMKKKIIKAAEDTKPGNSAGTSMFSGISVEKLIEELELQNAKLRQAIENTEAASRKFSALYEHAPTAYFTLNPDKSISDVNLIGASMLGKDKSSLLNVNFSRLVSRDTRPLFIELLKLAVETRVKQTCEVRLETEANPSLYTYLECIYFAEDNKCLLTALDITLRKQSEEKIRSQYFTLRGVGRSLRSPMFSVDTRYCYTSFNDAHALVMKSMYGAVIETGNCILDYMTVVEDRERAKKNLDRTLKGEHIVEEAYSGDDLFKRLCFEVSHNPVFDDDARVIGVSVFAREITERKHAEDELKHSEQRYHSLFSEMLEGFALHEIILDDKGKPVDYRFLEMNPAFEKMTGLNREHTIGKTVLELLPDTESYWIKKYGKVALTGKSVNFENYSASLDRHFQVAAFRTQPGQFAVMFNDISEWKRSVFELKISEEKYSKVFRNSPNAILITSLADGKIVEANDGVCRVAGYSMDELIGKTTFGLNIWEIPHERKSYVRKLSKSGRVINYEASFRRKSGELFTGLISGELIDLQGSKLVLSVIHDISDRKTMEHAIRASEENWRMLVKTIPDYIALYDKNDNYIFLNHFAEGYAQQDIDGKHYSAFLTEEVASDFQRLFENAKLTRETRYLEHTAPGDNLSLKYYESYFVPVFEDDDYTNMMVIARDITDRKRADAELKNTKEYLENLINYANAPIIVWDDQFKITQFNKAFERISGKSAAEVTGQVVDLLFPLFSREKSIEYIKKASAGYRWEVVENEIQHTDGSIRTLLWNSAAIYSPDGTAIIATIAQGQDITDRKKAEVELAKTKAMLQAAFDNSQAGIAIAEAPTGNLIYVNRAALLIRDKSRDEIVDNIAIEQYVKSWNILHFDGEPYKPEEVPLARAIMFGETVSEEFIVRRDSLEDRIVWANAAPIFSADGKVEFGIVIFLDVTDQKRIEDDLKDSEANLRQLNATKDKFFSIIAHDLKSPFNNIVVLSNLLAEQMQNGEKEGIEELAGLIQSSTQQAMSLLINLLDWSRSQTGRMVCSPEYVDIVALIHDVIDLMNESARQKSISLIMELPRNLLAYADKVMVSTIVRNLVSNAVKFTHPGGKVMVIAKRNQTDLLITVSDDGVGIKPGDIKKLFRIEESISTKGTENEKGTGLGLILCKEFVEKHGGMLWVESETGKGSKFSFTIPNFKKANS